MGVRCADHDRVGADVRLCGDALADVVGDALPDRENVDAGKSNLTRAVAQHDRLRREIVVHAGRAADSIAVTGHCETEWRLQPYSCRAGEQLSHDAILAGAI